MGQIKDIVCACFAGGINASTMATAFGLRKPIRASFLAESFSFPAINELKN